MTVLCYAEELQDFRYFIQSFVQQMGRVIAQDRSREGRASVKKAILICPGQLRGLEG